MPQATLVNIHPRSWLFVLVGLIIGEVLRVHRRFLNDSVKELVLGPIREPAVVHTVCITAFLSIDL
jgi:hypothetical protein